MFEVNHFRNIE